MVRKASLAIAAALIAITVVPASPSILGPIRQPRLRPGSHLLIDLQRLPYGSDDPLLGLAIKQVCGSRWGQVPCYAAYLQRAGRLQASWRPRWDRTVVLYIGGRLYQPAATRAGRAFGGGVITFAYSGWSASEQQQLSTYVDGVYPHIEAIYGAPASTITVTIIRDPALQSVLGGIYVPAVNEIHLPPLQDFSRDSFILASLIVRAFHDDLFLAPEAWETGFARAVALVAHLQVDPGFLQDEPFGDPYYVLPLYDLLNQRPLAGTTMFPVSGYAGMTPWRIGMAQAAWLKVYAENPAFFRDFNTAYYAEYDPAATPPLSANVPRLREIAAAAAPEVEDALFQDWFARQFVLDSDGWPGEKLYLAALPQLDNVTVYLEADYYRTTVAGDEQALAATGSFQYLLWDGRLNLPEAGDSIPITAGLGFLAPSFIAIGGAQRITIDLVVGNQIAQSWFPYGVVGANNQHNEYFGVVVDGDTGSVTVTPTGLLPAVTNVIRGIFSINQPAALNFLAQTAVELTPTGGIENTRLVNTGFLYQVLVLRAFPLQPGSVQHTFAAGTSMISLPESPDQSDAAKILGLTAAQTQLARWTATLPGQYAFYPDTPPIEPGLGYWLKLASPVTVNAHGLLPSAQYRLHLRRGWQQIANPFGTTVAVTGVQVKVGNAAPVSLSQAQANGSVGPLLRYTGAAYVTAQDLRPYEGLWMYVYPAQGCWLIIQEP